jgi:hypothetical protein
MPFSSRAAYPSLPGKVRRERSLHRKTEYEWRASSPLNFVTNELVTKVLETLPRPTPSATIAQVSRQVLRLILTEGANSTSKTIRRASKKNYVCLTINRVFVEQ